MHERPEMPNQVTEGEDRRRNGEREDDELQHSNFLLRYKALRRLRLKYVPRTSHPQIRGKSPRKRACSGVYLASSILVGRREHGGSLQD